ncbi:hypothetical protein F5Y09DRAFT_339608 [Xylaria sp. FL1042]|nr:hypothetical protein F5Y09DRAFT_339608 [Xylaria sp. FL1042]
MDQKDVFDMLLTSVRSPMSAFKSLRLSTMSSRRHVTGQGVEEFVVTNYEEDRALQVDGTVAEAGISAPAQRKEQALTAPGVRWRYAEQGMNIHRIAYLNKEDPTFSRKSYIDGMAYMLMALPSNLSDQEAAMIREAIPPYIADANLVGGGNDRAIGWRSPPGGRTGGLQGFIAMLVAVLVVLIHLTLSYASVVVRVGAHYERKHNISQQIVSRGFVIASAVGRHSIVLSAKICALKDGPVAKAVGNIASRAIESVAAGIQEGIGQGLVMIDTRPRPS